jgi:hypothetical protein
MILSDPTYDPEGNDLANKIIQEDSSFAKLKSLIKGLTYAQKIGVAQIACNQMAGSPPNQIIHLKPIGGEFDDQLKSAFILLGKLPLETVAQVAIEILEPLKLATSNLAFLCKYPLPKNKTMLLEISIPVYKKSRWNRLEIDGKLQVSSEVDTLPEGYQALKKEIEVLLYQVDSETRLAETALTLQLEIDEKTRRLIELKQDIERATEHYANFNIFLENLGIDPRKKQLTFDKHLLLSAGSVADVEATMPDPIDNEF